ncbi:MAG: ABC transporter ATP-binding protein [Actinomycetia bacterium]|nr:ABC transporter ATP-binding protein [Actinomycetes bacterium]
MTPAIELDHLTKSYGRTRGVVDLTLEVASGQVFGFLGPNGAGKSTAMRVLLDLHRPTSGAARVFGLDSHGDSLEVRRHVGYLCGDVALYDSLGVMEHLEWLGELRGGVDRSVIRSLAERFDLDLSRKVGDLSKGNRQKVGLVQAFMGRPDLLVLDEPTSGLDPLVQHEFQAMVAEVADEGRTVFLSSHVIDEVDRTCDRVAIIREGRLVTNESIESLRSRSLRTVRVLFESPVDPAAFEALADVTDARVDGNELTVTTTGDADALVKMAARHHVVDLVSERADLEEIFLAYYAQEDPTDTGGGGR